MKFPSRKTVAVCVSLIYGYILNAQDADPDLLVYEGFNHPVGSSVDFLNGGIGWSGPWMWRNNFDGKGIVLSNATRVEPGSLLFGDLETSGNSLRMNGDMGTVEPNGSGSIYTFSPMAGFSGITRIVISVTDNEGSATERVIGVRVSGDR